MENKLKTIELKKGRMAIYDFGALKLHAYETNDPLNDEVFMVENAGRGFVVEPPCFVENIVELEGYIAAAGIDVRIVPNDDAFDIEIPAMNAAYIHMMGHDCHSIVAGAGQVDALIGQLERLEQRGFDLILTSHHRPETRSDLRRKKAYLFDVGRLARESDSAASFRRDIMRLYPNHGGLNYLDMTEEFLFPRR